MKRSFRSLNDLDELCSANLPRELEKSSSIKKNWSFSHLLDLETEELRGRSSRVGKGSGWDGQRMLGERRASLGSEVPLIERFQKRLAQEVLDVVRKAQQSEDKDRTLLLEDLFYNSSSSIEPQVLAKLNTASLDKDNEMRQMRMVRFLKGKNVKTRFYFELVASYFCHSSTGQAMVQLLLPMCNDLWSHELFPPIFALLLHRWVLTHDVGENSSVLRFNVFLRGSNQLFWFDLQHNSRRLRSVYFFLVEMLSAQSISQRQSSSGVPMHLKEDLSRLICRFFLFYCNNPTSPSDIKILLLSLPPPAKSRDRVSANTAEQGQHAGDSTVDRKKSRANQKNQSGTAEFQVQVDRFIQELVKHLPVLKSEEIILLYLDGCRMFGKEAIAPYLSQESKQALRSLLEQFTSFGMPLYPTRNVRQKAKDVSNELFPGSGFYNQATHVGVLLLSPWQWPGLVINWSLGMAADWLSWVPVVGTTIDSLRGRAR